MNSSHNDDYDCSWQRRREIKKLALYCVMGWNRFNDLQCCAGIAVHGESDGCSGGQPLRRGLLPHTHRQRKPPSDELHETGLQHARPQVGLIHTPQAVLHDTGRKCKTTVKIFYRHTQMEICICGCLLIADKVVAVVVLTQISIGATCWYMLLAW